jgi:hypothetical protein
LQQQNNKSLSSAIESANKTANNLSGIDKTSLSQIAKIGNKLSAIGEKT